jgi:hypothetical protein
MLEHSIPLVATRSPRYTALNYQLSYFFASKSRLRAARDFMTEWSHDNGIRLQPAATDLMINRYRELNSVLHEEYTRSATSFATFSSFLRVFTRMYLYELRDRQRRTAEPLVPSQGFVAQISPPTLIINVQAVRDMLPDKYLGSIWRKLTTDKPFMEIQSAPTGMLVGINKEPRGRDRPTNGRLELPVEDKHKIVVAGHGVRCETSVAFRCAGYKGTLTCNAKTGKFEERFVDACGDADRGGRLRAGMGNQLITQ